MNKLQEIRILCSEVSLYSYRRIEEILKRDYYRFFDGVCSEMYLGNAYWLRILSDSFIRIKKVSLAWSNLYYMLPSQLQNEAGLIKEDWEVLKGILESLEQLMNDKDKPNEVEQELERNWLMNVIALLEKRVLGKGDQAFLKSINQFVSKKEFLRIKKCIDWSDSENLFHAVKSEYVRGILDRGSILGYTTQRYWPNGKRYKENEPEYEQSFWMKGISMTRDINYALAWSSVVFVFDRKEILKQHSVEPYSWEFHIADRDSKKGFKKEREDFVVLSKTGKTFFKKESPAFLEEYKSLLNNKDMYEKEEFLEYKEKYEKDLKSNKVDSENFRKPEGEFLFENAFKGFVIRGSFLDIYEMDNELVQYLVHHPKFLGFLDKDND